MFLVDTSAWILHFRRQGGFDLRSVCPPEERLLCLPVYQEILQGIREEAAFREIRLILDAAEMLEEPLTRSLHLEAATLYRVARQRGLTIRSGTDCLIAACAIRHDAVVLHRDRDYPALAAVSTLRQRMV